MNKYSKEIREKIAIERSTVKSFRYSTQTSVSTDNDGRVSSQTSHKAILAINSEIPNTFTVNSKNTSSMHFDVGDKVTVMYDKESHKPLRFINNTSGYIFRAEFLSSGPGSEIAAFFATALFTLFSLIPMVGIFMYIYLWSKSSDIPIYGRKFAKFHMIPVLMYSAYAANVFLNFEDFETSYFLLVLSSIISAPICLIYILKDRKYSKAIDQYAKEI